MNDKYLQIASNGALTIDAAGAVGSHIVDLIPPCTRICSFNLSAPFSLTFFSVRFIPDWFPGSGFKHLPPGTREALTAMREVPFNFVKEKMVRSPNGASYYWL